MTNLIGKPIRWRLVVMALCGLALIREGRTAPMGDEISPVGALHRNRVNILIVGEAWPHRVLEALQELTADEFNFHCTKVGSGSSLSPGVLADKSWHGALLCLQPGSDSPDH